MAELSGVSGSGLSIDSFQKVSEQASAAMKDVQDFSQNMDPTNQSDLLKMQVKMMKASIATQLQASLTKAMDDMLKAVVQRF